jgi:uncharacterized membrane protein
MRLIGLDIFRGYALFLMVLFHFSFDLNNFHYLDLDFRHGDFWKYFRYLIVSMFVFSAGISLKLANPNSINYKKLKKRVIVLALASALVSIGSYTQFPNTWIFFGILHFFLFASIFGLFFLNFPKISLVTGVIIILGYNFHFLSTHWLFTILQAPLHLPLRHTEDLANIVPWFGVFLLGITFANYNLHKLFFDLNFFNKKSKINSFFSLLGKHTLVIYLIHQPILFGVFFLLKSI